MTTIIGLASKLVSLLEPPPTTVYTTDQVDKATTIFLNITAPKNCLKALLFENKKFVIKTVSYDKVDTALLVKMARLNTLKIDQETLLKIHKAQLNEIRRSLSLEDELIFKMRNFSLEPDTHLDYIDSCIDAIERIKKPSVATYLFSQARFWVDYSPDTIQETWPQLPQDIMNSILEYCEPETVLNVALAIPKQFSQDWKFSDEVQFSNVRKTLQKQRLLAIVNLTFSAQITLPATTRTKFFKCFDKKIPNDPPKKITISTQKINLNQTNVDGKILHSLKHADSINLSSCKNLDESNFTSLRCPTPREVDLSLTYIKGTSFSSSFYKNTTVLDLFNCCQVTDEQLAKLSSTCLEKLNVAASPIITGKCLKVFHHLKYLNISDCPEVRDEYITCESLEVLIADRTPLTGACIKNLPKLREVSLIGCKLLQLTDNFPNITISR